MTEAEVVQGLRRADWQALADPLAPLVLLAHPNIWSDGLWLHTLRTFSRKMAQLHGGPSFSEWAKWQGDRPHLLYLWATVPLMTPEQRAALAMFESLPRPVT